MSELITIPAAELADLKERLDRLAREKAQLQLIALLMNRLGELPGLERSVEGMLKFVVDILGGRNATIYYRLDDVIHCVDVHGRKETLTEIEDDLVRGVFESREFASTERDFSETGLMTKEFTKATTWVMPLLVGTELVGVLRLDDLMVAGHELRDEVQTFLRYASLVLKNEISGELRLRRAFDEIGRATRAEAALAAQHSTLRGILEGTTSPIFSVDREYRYVAFNRAHVVAMRALYGAEIEVGRNMLDYMTVPEDREKAKANIDRALAGEHSVESAYSGEERWARRYFEVSHHPVQADDGKVVGVAVFANDVTERQRAEEAERKAVTYAEKLISSANAMIVCLDVEGKVVVFNDAAESVTGYRRDEVIGRNWFELVVPRDRFPEAWTAFEDFRKTGGSIVGDLTNRIVTKSGEERVIEWRNSDLLEAGNVVGTISYGLDVTERKRTESALRVSEEKFTKAFRSSPVALTLAGLESGVLVEANRAFENITGYSLAESLGRTAHQLNLYPDPSERERIADTLWNKGPVRNVEMHLRHKSGELRTVIVSSETITIDRTEYVLSTTEDITIRKRAEDALRDERRLFVGGPTVVFKWRAQEGWPVEYVSPNVADQFGYAPEELTSGKVLYAAIVHPDDLARVGAEVSAYSEQGVASFEQMYRIARPDGRYRWVDDFTTVIRGRDGAITHYLGYVLDITERKQAEEALTKSEERLRLEVARMPIGYIVWDKDFRVVTWNPAAEDIFGFTFDEAQGRHPYEMIVPPEAQPQVDDIWRRLLAGDTSAHSVNENQTKDGRTIVCEWTNTPLRQPNDTILGVMSMVQDITERVRAEREIARVNRALRMLGDTNQALIRMTDETTLLNEVCRIAVDVGGYHMAWVGFAEHDEAKTVRPVAHAGIDSGYIESAKVSWADDEHGRGPSGTAIRTGRPCIASNLPADAAFGPWRDAAIRRGFRSSVALPLISEGQTFGALGIYSGEADAFDAAEMGILVELAGDLAFGLTALRTRAKRDQAEAALRQSEERFRRLAENARDMIYRMSLPDGKYEYVSPAALSIFGYSPEDFYDRPLLIKQAVHPEWRRYFEEQWNNLIKGEMPPTYEYQIVHRAGDVRWLNQRNILVRDERARPLAIEGIVTDVTERKRAEEVLHRRDAELNESQRLAHIGSWDWDAVADTIWWSPEYYHIYDLDPDQPTPNYDEHLKAYTSESAQRLDTAVKRTLETGEPYEVDLELAHPTASTRWIVARGEVKRDADGKVVGLRGTAQNITERKRLEEEMRRSAAAIEQAAESIIITDPSAVIQYVNPAFTRVTGYSRDEAVGRNPRFLQSGKSDRKFYDEMWATLLRGETWHGHLINKRKDKTLFEEDATITPVRDERGGTVHYVAVKRDVTQEVALEGQLRQSQKMEAIGRLAGGIAHDFNNVLQAMLSHAQLLRTAPDRVATELAELEAQIQRGASLARQLLLFSRHEAARRETLNLNEVIREAGKLLRRLVRENVELVIETPEGAVIVDADKGQLHQVLMNLTINAADAMPGGGRVTISAGTAAEMAWFAVQDSGCGIPEELRDKVFEPFFTTKAAGHGTGLGLSVVHGIVAQHGGRIELESTVGAGTTFRVLLPRLATGEYPAVVLERPVELLAAGHGERVLVVEDETAAREGLRDILISLAYDVTAVGSGGEAGRLPDRPAFDVLITDIMLPDVDGIALARGLLSRWPGLRVVLMSGYSEVDVHARDSELGETVFLQKPFNMQQLAQAVSRALATRSCAPG